MKTTKNNKSVAVIGAGVVGICTAIELQQAGFLVTLFDKEEPAKQASFGNAAYIAAEYTEPLATPENIKSAIKHTLSQNAAFKITPDHLLKFIPWSFQFILAARTKEREQSRSGIAYLNKQSIDAWKRILKLTGNSDALVKSGFLKLWENSADLANAKNQTEKIKASGHEAELLQGNDLFDLEPALSNRISHGIYHPNGHQLNDTYQVYLKLFDYFRKQGGEFHQLQITDIQATKLDATLQTADEVYHFNKVIIAAGIWSKQLLSGLGLDIPLAAERGYHLTLPNIANNPRHILESTDRHVVLSSIQSGLRIVGFGEYANLDSKPTDKRYRQLKHHLSCIIKNVDFKQQPVKTGMGIRPTLPDSLPIIDLHPKHTNIGMVFGHHHLGVTQAAISAQLITDMLSKGSPSPNTRAYSVSRFL